VQRLDLRSSRIHAFTEEAAVLRVGRAEESTSRRVLQAMLSDNTSSSASSGGSNIHVLTTQPLELHSFVGISLPDTVHPADDASITTKSSSNNDNKAYIRHELLSANMGWRLGQFTPLLIPTEDGVAILMPELSMAIHVPSISTHAKDNTSKPVDGTAAALMIPLPDFKAFFSPPGGSSGGGGRGKGLMDSFFASNNDDSTISTGLRVSYAQSNAYGDERDLNSSEKSRLSTIYRPGTDKFALIDVCNRALTYVTIPSVGTFGAGSSSASSSSSGSGGIKSIVLLNSLDGMLTTGSGHKYRFSIDQNKSNGMHAVNFSQLDMPDSAASASATIFESTGTSSGGATFSGTSTHHASVAARCDQGTGNSGGMIGDGEWLSWPRNNSEATVLQSIAHAGSVQVCMYMCMSCDI